MILILEVSISILTEVVLLILVKIIIVSSRALEEVILGVSN